MGNLTLNGSTSGQITLTPTAVAGTNTLTLPAATDTLVGKATTDTLTNKTLTGSVLSAGTTSVAPLNFTSGTNLTSATAGAMEYDGKVLYATPQSTQRGIVPGAQFFRLNSDLAGANVATAQNTFGVGVTLSSSTIYEFECMYVLTRTAGTTAHNVSFGFGGTATINNALIFYNDYDTNTAIPLVKVTGSTLNVVNSLAATNTTGSITQATYSIFIKGTGTISVNAVGTIIPQYTLSAGPGGAYSTIAGSYFYIYPIGASGSNTSVGTWA